MTMKKTICTGYRYNSGLYSLDEMTKIVKTYTLALGVRISQAGIQELVNGSNGDPEIAVFYVKCIQKKMADKGAQTATLHSILNMFKHMETNKAAGPAIILKTKEKEIMPTMFRRSTESKKPNASSLKVLRKKIDQINKRRHL